MVDFFCCCKDQAQNIYKLSHYRNGGHKRIFVVQNHHKPVSFCVALKLKAARMRRCFPELIQNCYNKEHFQPKHTARTRRSVKTDKIKCFPTQTDSAINCLLWGTPTGQASKCRLRQTDHIEESCINACMQILHLGISAIGWASTTL